MRALPGERQLKDPTLSLHFFVKDIKTLKLFQTIEKLASYNSYKKKKKKQTNTQQDLLDTSWKENPKLKVLKKTCNFFKHFWHFVIFSPFKLMRVTQSLLPLPAQSSHSPKKDLVKFSTQKTLSQILAKKFKSFKNLKI